MTNKTLRTLEFDKIIVKLQGKAISASGKNLASELEPITDFEKIKFLQQETSEAVTIIMKRGSLPLGGIKDISKSLGRVAIGGNLNIQELLYVGDFLYVSKKMFNYGKDDREKVVFPILDEQFKNIITLPSLEKEISRCIVNEIEISDDASGELYSIRKNIKNLSSKIKNQLTSIIHGTQYKNMLQDNVITMRNDRYCVPVKSEYRNSFAGMVHDQSSTGATVFIEPMSVVQLNNSMRELLINEKKEIERILAKLSAQIFENIDDLKANLEILTYLDFVFAKGELSLEYECSQPIFNTKGYINLKKARHPLINPKDVVATDIYLGKEFTTLLITGPNTGGKTVSLKTVGLFTLMGQAGLHIPALDQSELAVFGQVFADIGDEQSIEQSLSTFSSHMTNIVSILENLTEDSLVLLDELGAGTDPTEGAALAISILQYLYDRGVRVLVTTHYSELKVYALGTIGTENASCEFDVETLRPTYKLLIGIPGKSNAFSISRKLGLPDYIIEDAKKLLDSKDEKFEDIITNLEMSKKTVILEQEKAENIRREVELLKASFTNEKEKLEAQKSQIISEAKLEARKLLKSVKDEADTLIRELNEKAKNKATVKELETTRGEIREKLSGVEEDLSSVKIDKKAVEKLRKRLKKGDIVNVLTMNQKGTLISLPDKNDDIMVQTGIMKIKVNICNVEIAKQDKSKHITGARNVSMAVKKGKSQSMKTEIDLRGYMVDEGVRELDKYIDDAYLSSLNIITIIHGKGTGALRKGVHEYLRTSPHVKSFRLGTFGEGEDGVTIIELFL